MATIREMFMDAAATLLKGEHQILGEMLKGVETRLEEVENGLNKLADYEDLKARLDRLERLTGFPAART